EAAEHMRANRFALEGPGEAEHGGLVDGNGEVIRPEVREPLDERALHRDGGVRARVDLCGVYRAVVARDLGDAAEERRVRGAARTPRPGSAFAVCLRIPRRDRARENLGRGLELGAAGDDRRGAFELRVKPAA